LTDKVTDSSGTAEYRIKRCVMGDTRVRTSKRNFIIALVLLLLTNILMGMVLMAMAKKSLREQINQHMLDVANAASAQLIGDELKTITPYERDTEEYQRAYKTLQSFKKNIELDYIYALYPLGDGTFSFGIDPDEEDPAGYGQLIEMTDALRTAASGTPAVDKQAHSDQWGRFYSAYSPFFDSEGQFVGIVGVDFNADLLDEKLNDHRAAAVIITMVALVIGIVLAFIIMSENRKRFSKLIRNLDSLELEAERLDAVIMKSSVKKLDMLPESESAVLKTLASGEENKTESSDAYDEIHKSIESIYHKLHKYAKYVDAEALTDVTTGVYNKAAYREKIRELDERINAGDAVFSVAFFDINGIKKIYTHVGYEAGEALMYECAKILKQVFGKNHVYHITGDEFVVLAEGSSRFDMEDKFEEFDGEVKKYNNEHVHDHQLSVAKGSATYEHERYSNYRSVLVEAKARCDKNKEDHYGRNKTLDRMI